MPVRLGVPYLGLGPQRQLGPARKLAGREQRDEHHSLSPSRPMSPSIGTPPTCAPVLRALSTSPRSASSTTTSLSHGSRGPGRWRCFSCSSFFCCFCWDWAIDSYDDEHHQDPQGDVPVLDREADQQHDPEHAPASAGLLLDDYPDRLLLPHCRLSPHPHPDRLTTPQSGSVHASGGTKNAI